MRTKTSIDRKRQISYAGPVSYTHLVPVNRYDNAAFVKTDGRMEYVGGDRASLAGVDVSSHQGTVDWAKVAADGIDFVIIRCGGRYYGSGKVFEDKQFKSNIQGALDAGLQVGVYFFSQATNQTEALEEAWLLYTSSPTSVPMCCARR